MRDFDVIVIGGGCNGTGVARDAAMRGLKTLLLEKGDLGGATTGSSSGMIHGGLRYLAHYDYTTTYHSSLDSGYIQRIAPFMIFRIPFLVAVPEGRSPLGRMKARLEITKMHAGVRAYDHFQVLKRGKRHVRLSSGEATQIEPSLRRDIVGAVTFDEWGIDPFRLCVANALSAQHYGAEVRTYTRVSRFIRDGRAVVGVEARDEVTDARHQFHARLVVNTTGPWSQRMASVLPELQNRVRLRPSKGVHVTLDRRLSNYAISCIAADGRGIFLMPHQSNSVIGTTDDDFYGDPDNIEITRDEIEYLLEGVEHMVPSVRQARVVRAWAGVRPTLFQYGRNEDELSRAHRVYDHADDDVPGLVSMAGGKLAAYRLMAQDCTDKVCERLGVDAPCMTHIEPLPGGESEVQPERWSSQYKVPLPVVERIAFRHGTVARKILATVDRNPAWAAMVCNCEGVIEAEVRHCIRNEWVRKGQDLMRRCRVGAGPCRGSGCALRAVSILAEEQQLAPTRIRALVAEFLQSLWKGVRPVLGGTQLAQEELHRAWGYGAANLDAQPFAAGPWR